VGAQTTLNANLKTSGVFNIGDCVIATFNNPYGINDPSYQPFPSLISCVVRMKVV
jgi:hypothetical protein